MSKEENLQIIPGVGVSIENDFHNIGIDSTSELQGKDPEELYEKMCTYQNARIDRCMLYVCREAVYFAETPESEHTPEKLKWWNWKDDNENMMTDRHG